MRRPPNRCNLGRARKGAAAVELAVLLPVLMLLFVITVDFARAFYYSISITNAARDGALWASDPTLVAANQSPYSSYQDAALSEFKNPDGSWRFSPPPTCDPPVYGTDSKGNAYVEVTVHYEFSSIVNFPTLPDTLHLQRTVRMRMAPQLPNF
jgi:Flp pilus assembly protein TadG